MTLVRRILALLCLCLLTGCATITTGTTSTVTILTNPEGANCTFSRDGQVIGVVSPTPGNLTVSKSNTDIFVDCKKEGYFDNKGTVGTKFQAMTLGNIILGGLIGIAVDMISGATSEYEPNITITLIPTSFATAADRDSFFDRLLKLLATESNEVRDRIKDKCGDPSQCSSQMALADQEQKKQVARLEEQRAKAVIGQVSPSIGPSLPATAAAPPARPVQLDDLKDLLPAGQ